MSTQVHGAQKFDTAKRTKIVFSDKAMQAVQNIIKIGRASCRERV